MRFHVFAACALLALHLQAQSSLGTWGRIPVQRLWPKQTQPQEVITIKGRNFSLPHVPATTEQAEKERRAVIRAINGTMDILESDLAELYLRFSSAALFKDFAMPKSKAALPEAAFFSSVIKDERLELFLDDMVGQWNDWQWTILQAGIGRLVMSSDESAAGGPATPKENPFKKLEYKKQHFIPILNRISHDSI